MLYFTGDTHGEKARFSPINMPDKPLTENDVLIICGDFGFIYYDTVNESEVLDELEKKPYTICFVDGNHENFPAIFRFPLEEWNGGSIHRIRKNVIHLMRGQVFNIQGKKVFTFGGAYSIDRAIRQKDISYWAEELPSSKEYKEAVENLKKSGMAVDYVVSHTAPKEIILRMGKNPDLHDIELTGFLEWVMYEVKFTAWYFGHWHQDKTVYEKFRALYFDVVSER